MKKKKNISRAVFWVALLTLLILSVPLIAMQFTAEVNWSLSDFIIMGALLFTTGLSYVLLASVSGGIVYKIAVALSIGSTFLLIWANLAVGLIGSGANAANLMYAAIVIMIITGSFLCRFSTKRMQKLMFTVAAAFVLFVFIQLLANMQQYDGSSVTEIITVNVFFAVLFAVSALLFRFATFRQLPAYANEPV